MYIYFIFPVRVSEINFSYRGGMLYHCSFILGSTSSMLGSGDVDEVG
jgi:hypothetical protein